MRKELQIKIEQAIKLLQQVSKANNNEPIELAYSGGKDSDVILQLAKEANIPIRPIYKNTTIDPAGTIKHVQENGVEIVRPQKRFFELIENKGVPSRFVRFCCDYLKEYKIMDKVIVGVRKEESAKRAKNYQEPTQCRVYRNGQKVEQIFPILDWTLKDVQEFIEDRHIKLAPVYYDANGVPDYTKRLGCLCCPLKSTKKRLEDFKEHPIMLRQYTRAAMKWWNAKPRKNHECYTDIYEYMYVYLFADGCKSKVALNRERLFKSDYKSLLENYFNVELP